MKINSILEIFSEIKNIINANPIATNIGVVTNDYCGEEYLISLITHYYESKLKTKVLVIEKPDIVEINSLSEYFKQVLNEDFGDTIEYNLSSNSYTDLVLSFLSALREMNINSLLVVIKNFDFLESDKQYKIASQLRNTREKIKTLKQQTNFHSIVLGKFSYFKQVTLCQKYGTSFILDDIFYLGNATRIEMECILKEEIAIKNISEANLKVFMEIIGGSVGLLSNFIEENDSSNDINKLIRSLVHNKNFESIVNSKLEELDNYLIQIILEIVDKKLIKYSNNELLEQLFLTGLVNIIIDKDHFTLEIRSWLHEILIRKFFSKHRKDLLSYEELIPPCQSINTTAYSLVMEIENSLRNYLIAKLSKYHYTNHPLELLDNFGEVKNTPEGKNYRYYDWCKHKLVQQKEVYNISSYRTLSSHLDLKDLENIFLSELIFNSQENKKYVDIFEEDLPVKADLRIIFKRLKHIRNPLAHNNLLSPKVLDELKEIRRKILI